MIYLIFISLETDATSVFKYYFQLFNYIIFLYYNKLADNQ